MTTPLQVIKAIHTHADVRVDSVARWTEAQRVAAIAWANSGNPPNPATMPQFLKDERTAMLARFPFLSPAAQQVAVNSFVSLYGGP